MGPLLPLIVLCLSAAVPHRVKASDGEEPTSPVRGVEKLNNFQTAASCSMRPGPCHPNPCHNRGTCEISETYRGDTFIGYVCKCPPGFTGVHCQHSAGAEEVSTLVTPSLCNPFCCYSLDTPQSI